MTLAGVAKGSIAVVRGAGSDAGHSARGLAGVAITVNGVVAWPARLGGLGGEPDISIESLEMSIKCCVAAKATETSRTGVLGIGSARG